MASLDPRSTGQVLDLVRRVSREDGLTVLMSLHQVDLARRVADRIAGLARGRLVFAGPADALDGPALATIYGDRQEAEEPDAQRGLVALVAHA